MLNLHKQSKKIILTNGTERSDMSVRRFVGEEHQQRRGLRMARKLQTFPLFYPSSLRQFLLHSSAIKVLDNRGASPLLVFFTDKRAKRRERCSPHGVV
jgi:hypothetical protein